MDKPTDFTERMQDVIMHMNGGEMIEELWECVEIIWGLLEGEADRETVDRAEDFLYRYTSEAYWE